MSYRAVIFDLGGVVLASPFRTFARFETAHGLATGTVTRVILGGGLDGAWARLERGELELDAFCAALDDDAAAHGTPFSAAALMAAMTEMAEVRPQMLSAIRDLRTRGLRVAALTNNWKSRDELYRRMGELQAEFDVFVESCKVGLRKPDPRIYELALGQLGVSAAETIFLDDIGANLKPARALGMATIKVDEPDAALAELQRALSTS